jgi:hypothetical protein
VGQLHSMSINNKSYCLIGMVIHRLPKP